MTKWLRSDTADLAEVAGQLALTPDEAIRAITIGARFIALGYTDDMVNDMHSDYQRLMRISWERWGR